MTNELLNTAMYDKGRADALSLQERSTIEGNAWSPDCEPEYWEDA